MGDTFEFEKDGAAFSMKDRPRRPPEDNGEPIWIPRVDPRKAAALKSFRPSFFDPLYGVIEAELHAIVVDDVSFETIAYYDAIVPEGDGLRLTTYCYGVVDNVVQRLQVYPPVKVGRDGIAHRHPPRFRLGFLR